jgi:hypothetical protein
MLSCLDSLHGISLRLVVVFVLTDSVPHGSHAHGDGLLKRIGHPRHQALVGMTVGNVLNFKHSLLLVSEACAACRGCTCPQLLKDVSNVCTLCLAKVSRTKRMFSQPAQQQVGYCTVLRYVSRQSTEACHGTAAEQPTLKAWSLNASQFLLSNIVGNIVACLAPLSPPSVSIVALM